MRFKNAASFALCALSVLAIAKRPDATSTFNMADPKGVSGLTFEMDSPLEPIVGQSSAISGTVNFNADHPELSTGKISVKTDSVTLAGEAISHAAQQDWCLAPAKFPTIEFEIKKIDHVVNKNGVLNADVTGDFTLHGVTKPVTAHAQVTPLKDMVQVRGGIEGKKGDLLKVMAEFTINRLAFGVGTSAPPAMVGKEIRVKLGMVGYNVKN